MPAAFVHEDMHCVAFMDAYPLRPGHVLVIPRRHAALMTELQASERTQLMELGARIARAMRKLDPAGDINWMVNDGKAANQHVPHVHLHLVPRRRGDGAALIARFGTRALAMMRARHRPAGTLRGAAAGSIAMIAQIVAAILLYVSGVALALWVELRLLPLTERVTVTHWLLEYALLPLLRIAVLIIFLFAAYPALFGLQQAPSLTEVLAPDRRIHTLLNTLFALGLLLPLVPGVRRFPGLVFPLHAIAGASLLAFWLGDAMGVKVKLLPGLGALGFFLALALAGDWIAGRLVRSTRAHEDGWDEELYTALVLFCQAPAILLYTLTLGSSFN